MSLKPYPDYKDSCTELLGEVPDSWTVTRLGSALDRKKVLVGSACDEYLLLSLTMQGVIPRDMENRVGKVPADFTTYQAVKKNDLVFCLFDVAETPRTIGWVPQNGMVTGAYTAASVRNGFYSPFIAYYYLAFDQYKSLRGYYAGLRNTIRSNDFSNIPLVQPTLSEQIAIADYLDRETAEIDAFIADQEELITLLNERRAATITQAVTKGIDPTAPMKDSGVEWLGNIPADWSMSRIKHVATTHIGLTYSPDDIVDADENGTLVLRSGNIQNGHIDLTDRVYVSRAIPSSLRVQDGDILICARNGSRSLIGKCALIGQESRGNTFGAFMTVLRSDASAYLYWILNSTLFKAQMGLFVTATINQLTNATLNNFEIPIPPPATSRKIMDHIQWEVGEIDATIADAKEAIGLSRERRAALISAAVTGKIDVRDAVASKQQSLEGELVVH